MPSRFNDKNNTKVATVVLFSLVSLVVELYALLILHTSIVYSHLFYVPIVLAGLWWGRLGILVTGVLGIAFLAINIISYSGIPDISEFLRLGVLVVVGVVVSELREQGLRNEQMLLESREKYRDLYDTAPDMYHSLDKDGIITNCNETEARMLGYTKDEVIGRPLTDFFTEASKKLFEKDFPNLKEGENQQLEREFVRKDGTTFIASLNVFPKFDENGKMIGTRTISRDITKLKKVEEEIRESEVRLRLLMESTKDIIVTQDLNGTYQYYNGPPPYGITVDDIIGKTPFDIYESTAATKIIEQLKKVVQTGKILTIELQMNWMGKKSWFINQMFPIKDEKGNITGVATVSRNITTGRQTEDALRDSEERFRRIFEAGPLGMSIVGLDHRFIKANSKVCQMLGYTEKELTSLTFADITHPDDVASDIESAKKLFNDEISVYKTEKHYIKKNKEIGRAALTISLVRDKDGKPLYFLTMVEDIGERNQDKVIKRMPLQKKV